MALGFDQKKPSIQPQSAAACHSATRPTRMPTCAGDDGEIGQSFCTGRRRTDFAAAAPSGAGRSRAARRDAWCPGPPCQAASSRDESWPAISSARQRSLIAMNSGVSVALRSARPCDRHRHGLDDAARPRRHDVNLVGEIDRLLDIVGDEHHRLAEIGPQPQQPFLHLQLGLRIERAERLVEQNDVGVEQQRAQQGGALAHAAGQRVRIEIFEAGKPVAPQQRQRALARLAQRHALDLHAEDDVVEHGAPRQQQILLQHVADAADGAGCVGAVDQHAAAGRFQKPGDDVEDRALAAARRADQADETALRNRQRHRRQRRERAVRRPEGHADLVEAKLRTEDIDASLSTAMITADNPSPAAIASQDACAAAAQASSSCGSNAASKALAIACLLLPAFTASPITVTVCPARAAARSGRRWRAAPR